MSGMTIGRIDSALQSGDTGALTRSSRDVYMENVGGFAGPSAPTAGEIADLRDGTAAARESGDAGSFAQMLKDGLDKVNEAQVQADNAVKEAIAGRNKNIHETMLLIEKADMTYKFAMQVRNKIIDAYREVMKMQV